MSTLLFYTVLTALWAGIAWLPYILDRVMVRGLMGALANPSPDAKPQSAWAQRAMRAHTVLIEAFTAFAPLAVIAHLMIPEDGLPGTLAAIFFWAMIAHYIVYAAGIAVVRTFVFVPAALSTLALALRLLGVI